MLFLVLGTGRSGTTTVASILHNKLGVYMGSEFYPSEYHPNGNSYEDLVLRTPLRHLNANKIKFNDWSQLTASIIYRRQHLRWGYKDPVMTYWAAQFIAFCPVFPRIIWCQRDKELVVKSMMLSWDRTHDWAMNCYWGRWITYKRLLSKLPHLLIDFGKDRVPEEDIKNQITEKWPDVCET